MRRLLLADGSITIQRVIELTFAGQDVQVIAVSDGEQAIVRIPIERPDVVLVDVATRKRSGYDVCAFVKAQPDLAHIPVLLLTAAFEPLDQARADAAKCDGVIVKPFDPSEVVARVREFLYSVAGAALPGAPEPAPVTQSGQAGGVNPLDDYFNRLDAAFATLGAKSRAEVQRPAPRPDETAPEPDIPTVQSVLGEPPTEALVDEITRRVLERLPSDARVADAIDRAVREELGKSQVQNPKEIPNPRSQVPNPDARS